MWKYFLWLCRKITKKNQTLQKDEHIFIPGTTKKKRTHIDPLLSTRPFTSLWCISRWKKRDDLAEDTLQDERRDEPHYRNHNSSQPFSNTRISIRFRFLFNDFYSLLYTNTHVRARALSLCHTFLCYTLLFRVLCCAMHMYMVLCIKHCRCRCPCCCRCCCFFFSVVRCLKVSLQKAQAKIAPFYFSNAALTPAIIIINITRNPSAESEAKNLDSTNGTRQELSNRL